MIEVQTCCDCKTVKSVEDFYVLRRRGGVDRQRRCKSCAKQGIAAWKKANPEKNAAQKRRQKLKKVYGIDEATYQALLDLQGDCCAICKGSASTAHSNKLSVDHDHVTGAVRGLLCYHCNTGLGLFRDRPDLLEAAITYLGKVR